MATIALAASLQDKAYVDLLPGVHPHELHVIVMAAFEPADRQRVLVTAYLGKIPNLTNIFQMGLKPPTSKTNMTIKSSNYLGRFLSYSIFF